MSAPDRVFILGEDSNDTGAIRHLLVGIWPDLERRVKPLRRPVAFTRDLTLRGTQGMVERVVHQVEMARRKRDRRVLVVVHSDAEGVEPAHVALMQNITDALDRRGVACIAAVPAWELEAWWFLWPTAATEYRPSWKAPDQYLGKRVGLIEHAKEEFVRCVRPPRRGGGFRDYVEADSVPIAEKVVELGLVRRPGATSDSYTSFLARVDEVAASPG